MKKNIEKFKEIFLLNEYQNNLIFIAINSKISYKMKSAATDLYKLIPDSKLLFNIKKKNFFAEMNNQFKSKKNIIFFFFYSTKKRNNQLIISSSLYDFTYRFSVHNYTSSSDFRFIGNCLKWAKPIISFDSFFDKKPYLNILKRIFISAFSSKSKNKISEPLIDHVISFVYINSKIWLRVYQIKYVKIFTILKKKKNIVFLEVGPRISLFLVQIWSNLKKKKMIDFTNI